MFGEARSATVCDTVPAPVGAMSSVRNDSYGDLRVRVAGQAPSSGHIGEQEGWQRVPHTRIHGAGQEPGVTRGGRACRSIEGLYGS